MIIMIRQISPGHFLIEVAHFFQLYKQLEADSHIEAEGWEDAATAKAQIRHAVQLYKEKYPLPGI